MLKTLIKPCKRLVKTPQKIFFRFKVKRIIPELESHSEPTIRNVGSAIREVITNSISAEETDMISLIEIRREALLRSNRPISVTDYGAGTPAANRTIEEMRQGVKSKTVVSNIASASKSPFWGALLFKLIRKFEPNSCLELGTCVGISASYQASALKINERGSILSLEGCPNIANLAKETFETLGLTNTTVVVGPFHKTFEDALKKAAPIDFFFNDGHHTYDAAVRNFERAVPHLSSQAVVVVDDINWSSGMRRAWKVISSHENVSASINLGRIGIVLTDPQPSTKEEFNIPLINEF